MLMNLKRTGLFIGCLCALLFLTACSISVENPSEEGSGAMAFAAGDAALPEISDLLHGEVSSIYISSFGKHAATEDPGKIAEIMELVEQIRFRSCTLESAYAPGASPMYLRIDFTDGNSLGLSVPVNVFSDGTEDRAYALYIGSKKAIDVLPSPSDIWDVPQIGDLLQGEIVSVRLWAFRDTWSPGTEAETEDPEKIAAVVELVEQIRFEPCALEEADRPGARDAVVELRFADGRSLSLSLPVAVFSDGGTESAFRAYIGDQKANELLPVPESLGA